MNIDKELVTTYRDVVITYDERHDKWRFNLRGKDRSAETLTNAKNTIDAPPPKEEKAFKRFEAWYRSYSGLQPCTVTSLTEGGRYWITYTRETYTGSGVTKKERTQAGQYEIYPSDPQNDAVVIRIKAKNAEIDVLRKELGVIQKELRIVEPKDWEVSP